MFPSSGLKSKPLLPQSTPSGMISRISISGDTYNVSLTITKLIESCDKNDTIYLHFSCHGQPVEDLDNDEEDGWDESIVSYDAQKHYREGFYVGENHITDDELHRYLHDIRIKVGPHGFVYVVLDACHAGSSYRGENTDDKIYTRGTNKGFSSSNKLFAPRIDKRGFLKVEKADAISTTFPFTLFFAAIIIDISDVVITNERMNMV